MTRICCLTLAFALLAGTGQARDRETAKEAIARIQEASARPSHESYRELFTKDAFGQVQDETAAVRRVAMAAILHGAEITGVRQKGDEAIATLKPKADIKNRVEREVLLRREDGRWRIASGRTYAAPNRAEKPAKLRLTMRTKHTAYGTSAFSFAYVTGDPALCKNRMDLWFCHNEDFHAVSGGRLAHLGRVSLKRVTRVPLGLAWSRTVAVRKGHTYVLHCKDPRDRDFFVKFKVTKMKRGIAQLEWALLTGGFGAPKTIHEARPLLTNHGADGCDALCRKRR